MGKRVVHGGTVVWRRPLVALIVLLAMASSVGACTTGAKKEQPEPKASLNGLTLAWNPKDVAAAGSCLVGWRSGSDAHGLLVVLDPDGGSNVLWEAPLGQPPVQIEDIAPNGTQMLGSVVEGEYGRTTTRHIIFRSDGGGEVLPLPKGFEDIADAGFMGEDLLVLARHATAEDYSTQLGVVGVDGRWNDLTISGQVPDHWFIESFVTFPGSDVVGLVLKIGSGTGDRDDDAIVLAKRSGTDLQVFTPAYADDALPGCEPLWNGQGVVFGKPSTEPASDAAAYVRVVWTGTEWVESIIAPTTSTSIIEQGDVIAEDTAGNFWVRSTGSGGHEATSTLLRVPNGTSTPQDTGIDATGVEWFRWIDVAR